MENRRIQPMNIRTIKSAVEGARQYVQDEKITISRTTITTAQYRGRWPEEYNSFVGSETRGNRYKDPDRFFRVMHAKPQWYSRKFIFRPVSDVARILRDASLYANEIIHQQAAKFTSPQSTGHYSRSFRLLVDGTLATESSLNNLSNNSVVSFINTAEYGAWLEAYSLYYRASIGGVLYYAGQKVRAKYPEIGVRFIYQQAVNTPGVSHKYAMPVLKLGSRENVIDKLSKPGKNIRRERRSRRRRDRA